MSVADFGADIGGFPDYRPGMDVVSGRANLGVAQARRFMTPRGSLFYDLDYGIYVPGWLGDGLTIAKLSELRSLMTAEAEKDERVESADVDLKYNWATSTLIAVIDHVTAFGPFRLVLSISDVTVSILNEGGSGTAGAPNPTTGTTPAEPIASIVTGPAGPAGPPGPAGASGGGGGGTGLAVEQYDDSRHFAVSATSEEVVAQWTLNMDDLSATTLAIEFSASVYVLSGTGTFRVYLGGTDNTADGTQVCSFSTSSATFVKLTNTSGTVSPIAGATLIKVTAVASVLNQDAHIKGIGVSVKRVS